MPGLRPQPGGVRFIEAKAPDMARIGDLLRECEAQNQWANRGPLYERLANLYAAHANISPHLAMTPCANGGIALEALARFHDLRVGRSLRWAVSAFSFANLGRGYFSDALVMDCDATGMLDLSAAAEAARTIDGLIVTNIFGCWTDFSPYIEFAVRTGKVLLIDNAAGMDTHLPDWPYQSFSLHHTKPYGMGEGGLLLSPAEEAEQIYELLDYGAVGAQTRTRWLNNGKLSDIACAFLIDRLEKMSEWSPRYAEQAARVTEIAKGAGLRPLVTDQADRPTTSRAFMCPGPVSIERVRASKFLKFGKYYKPIAEMPAACSIYDHLVNIPTHPDVVNLNDGQLREELGRLATDAD